MLGMIYAMRRGKTTVISIFQMVDDHKHEHTTPVPINSVKAIRGMPVFLTDKITKAVSHLPNHQMYYRTMQGGHGIKTAAGELGIGPQDIANPIVEINDVDVMVDNVMGASDVKFNMRIPTP